MFKKKENNKIMFMLGKQGSMEFIVLSPFQDTLKPGSIIHEPETGQVEGFHPHYICT